MKWLFLARNVTRRFLNQSQEYQLHGGSCHRYIQSFTPTKLSKSYQILYSPSLILGRYCSTSTTLNVVESSHRLPTDNKLENGIKKVDLEIISRETIKPSYPTPHHSRTFNLSIIDQYAFDFYTPSILFLPNTDNASVTDAVTERSKHLKEALSKVLTQFYPIAGKIKSHLQIECNDEGVCYIEARVNQTLQDFLHHPDDVKMRELLPESPCVLESSIGNYVMGIQVNIFLCGGIAICTNASHKIFDGYTFNIFMKAWAAAARGSPETISPSFVASEIFPNNPCAECDSLSSKLRPTKMLSKKRFVFDSTALASLKARLVAKAIHGPTRMEVTTGVVWKAVANATSQVRHFGPESLHALWFAVNIRNRASPPLPNYSIGNIVDVTDAMCYPEQEVDLPTLISEMRKSIARVNSDHIESIKGVKGHETFKGMSVKMAQLVGLTGEGGCLLVTSLLRSGIYDLDFGWGKPIWFYVLNVGSRILVLNETLKGGGVEATLTLSPEEMEIVERDPELLSYACVNPSPLRFLKH